MVRALRKAIVAIALLGSMGTASAALFSLSATMSGLAENPVNASPATGVVFVDLDTLANTLRIRSVFSGLLGPTTMAHLHCCVLPPGTVGVATTTPSLLGFPLGVTVGAVDTTLNLLMASSYNPTFINNNGGTPSAAAAVLIAGILAGQTYFNIHTEYRPGGEIRGFLPQVVPEPWSVLLIGIGAVAAVASRRRRR